MQSFWILLIVGAIAICILQNRLNQASAKAESFNTKNSKKALFDHPNECPFDYISLDQYQDHTDKYVVRSKLKYEPEPEFDNIFESIDDFKYAWDEMTNYYPNLTLCGSPYDKYSSQIRKNYKKDESLPYTSMTTITVRNNGNENFASGSGDDNHPQSKNNKNGSKSKSTQQLKMETESENELVQDIKSNKIKDQSNKSNNPKDKTKDKTKDSQDKTKDSQDKTNDETNIMNLMPKIAQTSNLIAPDQSSRQSNRPSGKSRPPPNMSQPLPPNMSQLLPPNMSQQPPNMSQQSPANEKRIVIDIKPIKIELQPSSNSDDGYVHSMSMTTGPPLNGGSVQKAELPSIYDSGPKLQVRPLTRDEHNPSQINQSNFSIANVPQLDKNEQIDTSVQPTNLRLPSTYSNQQIQNMKNGMLNDNFERQRDQQKLIMGLNAEIERLRNEINETREQLMYEKEHFENLNSSIEQKRSQIDDINRINSSLNKKITDLQKKNSDVENLYLQADSQRNTFEVRLNNLRKSQEEAQKNKGNSYTFVDGAHMSLNQWRPPICIPQKECPVCPSLSTNNVADYMTVFDEGVNAVLPKFKYEMLYDGKYYTPSPSDKQWETKIRKNTENTLNANNRVNYIDKLDFPDPNKATSSNLPYSQLTKANNTIFDSDGYKSK
jgi:hypothetical protein